MSDLDDKIKADKDKDLLIFKDGEKISKVRRSDLIPRRGAIFQLFELTVNNEVLDVMYVFDVDYGIVIPNDIAIALRGGF